MSRTKLNSLLASGPFTPGTVRPSADICDEWFKNDAGLVAFACRAVFRDLVTRGWDDPQGVPTPEFDRFVADVLPKLHALLAAPPIPIPTAELADLTLAYHSSI